MDVQELLLTINKDIEKVKKNISEIKNYEEPKLNSIQEAVNKRIREETGQIIDDLKDDIHFATEKYSEFNSYMYKAVIYLDEIGKKVLEVEELLKKQ